MTLTSQLRSIHSGFPAAVLALAACAAVAWADEPPAALAFAQATVDAGDVYQFAVLEQRFDFTNTSERDVRITGIQAGDPAAEVEPQTGLFAPGQDGSLRIRQPLGPRLGEATFRFTVLTDDPLRPGQELVLSAFVQSAYDDELPFLDFGDVDRSLGKTLPFEVATREADSVDLVEVVSAPDFVRVTPGRRVGVGGESLELAVTVDPGARPGLQVGVLHLRTSVAHHPDYLIRFRAGIFGDVVPGETPLQLGMVRVGEAFSAELQLSSRTGRPFRVGPLKDSRGWLQASASPCGGGAGPSDCWIVTARQTAVRPGQLAGVLEAQVDGEVLPLAYTGLAIDRDAAVRDLGQLDSTGHSKHTVGDDGPQR